VSQARALEHAERTVSLEYPCMRKSGDMYLTERLEMFRALKLHSKDVTPPVNKSKHLGRAARRRTRTVPGLESTAKARERFNAARRNDYAHQLTSLTQSIGDSLMKDNTVPVTLWAKYDKLNADRRFQPKEEHTEAEVGAGLSTCGPGAYLKHHDFKTPHGRFGREARFGEGGKGGKSRKTAAQSEAIDRIGHPAPDWPAKERQHLQRLYDEFGRPARPGRRTYDEHLDNFVVRHTAIYPHREAIDVRRRVDEALRLNKFREPGEGDYWRHVGTQGKPKERAVKSLPGFTGTLEDTTGSSRDPRLPRAPSWVMGERRTERYSPPAPGPREGGSEPFEYKSIGDQLLSNNRTASGVVFSRVPRDPDSSKLTAKEEVDRLEPTATTYTPKFTAVHASIPVATLKGRDALNTENVNEKYDAVRGPGSYEVRGSMGLQADSSKRSNKVLADMKSGTWTGRLPLDLEPLPAKFAPASKLELPPEPKLTELH